MVGWPRDLRSPTIGKDDRCALPLTRIVALANLKVPWKQEKPESHFSRLLVTSQPPGDDASASVAVRVTVARSVAIQVAVPGHTGTAVPAVSARLEAISLLLSRAWSLRALVALFSF